VRSITSYFDCTVSVVGLVFTTRRDTATLLGLVKRQSAFTPVEDLKARADFESVFTLQFCVSFAAG